MSALHDHVLRLLHESPDGLPPGRGFDLPDPPASAADSEDGRKRLSPGTAAAVIAEELRPLPADPATLDRRFAELGVRGRHRQLILSAVAALPLPAEQHAAARALARGLTRSGATVPAVIAGLALLARVGEPEDVPCLSALGLLRPLTGPAVQALDVLDRQAAAVVWLISAVRRPELRPLVRALGTGDSRAVPGELVAVPAGARFIGAAIARRIAEAVRLPDLLAAHPADPVLLARAGRLLVRTACSSDGPTELLAYDDARSVYETVVGRAALLPPTLDHHATLLSLAQELSSGAAVLLDWPAGRREALLASLGRLLAEPSWAALAETDPGDARAGWIRRAGRRPFTTAAGRLRIEVVAGDPGDREPVEARILVDGRPLVPDVFASGPVHSPERLLDDGLLRAGPEPRRVQLAEAWCTEGCCGALYVTIRRDGAQVVWEEWERPNSTGSRGRPARELPTLRFDAAAYDAEIARAEADDSWSWRARRTARLIKAGLVARPELLGRWDARRGWISTGHGTGHEDPDTIEVTFSYAPGLGSGAPDGHPLQFRWTVRDDGTPPEAQAAAALRRLGEEDPKTYAQVCGGSRERAAELGFPWPPEYG
ncbi:hypothetical protein ACWCPF_04540 [Streptomyces sp. NPDC001858]